MEKSSTAKQNPMSKVSLKLGSFINSQDEIENTFFIRIKLKIV